MQTRHQDNHIYTNTYKAKQVISYFSIGFVIVIRFKCSKTSRDTNQYSHITMTLQ